MKLSHVSITARDAEALAEFYSKAFGMSMRRPATRLNGDKVARGNGLPGSDICAIWLDFPGGDTPFLEIIEYRETAKRGARPINAPGFAHIALAVGDMDATLDRLVQAGGTLQGEVVNLGSSERPFFCVYVRDPEGNVIELEHRAGGGPQ